MSKVKISTQKGDMIVELFDNETPKTVQNFLKLINDKFYDGLTFHRVIPGFVAQGGCPNGVGNGGPGYTIQCETMAPKQFHDKGVLSMAHAGPNTGGSQFFICFVPCPHLDGGHTVFGGIEENDEASFATLDAINQGDKILSVEILEAKN